MLIHHFDPDLSAAGQWLVGTVYEAAAAFDLDLIRVCVGAALLDSEHRLEIASLGVLADVMLVNVNASDSFAHNEFPYATFEIIVLPDLIVYTVPASSFIRRTLDLPASNISAAIE